VLAHLTRARSARLGYHRPCFWLFICLNPMRQQPSPERDEHQVIAVAPATDKIENAFQRPKITSFVAFPQCQSPPFVIGWVEGRPVTNRGVVK
jgi:hypothetical protein